MTSPGLAALIAAWKRFDIALWSHDGFDEAAFEELKSALELCAREWAGQPSIPRVGANILVDIFPATESNAAACPGEQGRRILDAALTLQNLVWKCVALDQSAAGAAGNHT
ncbi:hypothetical protein [Asanoa sp. NPDC050611]|uniref:hypothetical protein n=1 Tax=Asanoa sp. NPDC050611 TaxID=3157098 RepID=UPI0033D0EE1C